MSNSNENKNYKVKIDDYTKIKILKTLLDDNLNELQSDINKDEITNIFKELLSELDFENFKAVVNSLSEETLEKINKRIKTEFKIVHKYLVGITEEDKQIKDNIIKIEKEQTNLELESQVNEILNNIKSLIEKQKSLETTIDDHYSSRIKALLNNEKYIYLLYC